MTKTIRLTAAQALVRYLTAQVNEDGDSFIAGEVQRQFLDTGLKASLGGWAAAAVTFMVFGMAASDGTGDVTLLPQLQMPWTHYLILLAVPVAATALTAIAARMTVMRALAPTL